MGDRCEKGKQKKSKARRKWQESRSREENKKRHQEPSSRDPKGK